jgi:hypothetical protein
MSGFGFGGESRKETFTGAGGAPWKEAGLEWRRLIFAVLPVSL